MTYKTIPACLCVMSLLLVSLPSVAEEIDIENAPTPVGLLELLPEGGINAVQLEAWVISTRSNRQGQVGTLGSYTHWSIKPVDGKLVVQMKQGWAPPRQFSTLQRFIYTAEGELDAYHEIRESQGKPTANMIGKVEGENLVIKPNPEVGVLNISLSRERTVAMETFATHVPVAWMPLVRAYHLQSGHLGYEYATVDLTRSSEKIGRSVEDVGAEIVTIQGKEHVAHLLLEQRSRKNRTNQQADGKSKTMVLSDGSTFSSVLKHGQYTFTSRRVSIEDVRKSFVID
ncbi:MAG: hypothetical protein AB8C95_08220 [Phycisphaeraceae bacterium]